MVLFKVFFPDGSSKPMANPLNTDAAKLSRAAIRKLKNVENAAQHKLYLVAPSFERYYQETETPLTLSKTLTTKNPKSTLHLKFGDFDQIVLKIFLKGEKDPIRISLNENATINDALESFAKNQNIEDVSKTNIATSYQNQNLVILTKDTKIMDLIKNWGNEYEEYTFWCLFQTKETIKGMEEFFQKCQAQIPKTTSLNEFIFQILDIISEGNKQYLSTKGFDFNNLEIENLEKNRSILETIQNEMKEKDTITFKYIARLQSILQDLINQYINVVVPKTATELGIKQNVETLEKLLEYYDQIAKKTISNERSIKQENLIQELKYINFVCEKTIIELIYENFEIKFGYSSFVSATGIKESNQKNIQYLGDLIFMGIFDTQQISKKGSQNKIIGFTNQFIHFYKLDEKINIPEMKQLMQKKNYQEIISRLVKYNIQHSFPIVSLGLTFISSDTEEKQLTIRLQVENRIIEMKSENQEEMIKFVNIFHISQYLRSKEGNKHTIYIEHYDPKQKGYECEVSYSMNNKKQDNSIGAKLKDIVLKKSYELNVLFLGSSWELKKKILDFHQIVMKLIKKFPLIIMPRFPKYLNKFLMNEEQKKQREEEKSKLSVMERKLQKTQNQYKKIGVDLLNKFIESVFHELMENGNVSRDINIVNFLEMNSISRPIDEQNVEYLRFLLEKNKMNAIKVVFSYEENKSILIRDGAIGNNQSKEEALFSHILFYSYSKEVSTQILDLLISTGCNANSQNKEGQTILHLAVNEGNQEVFDFLVNNKRIGLDVRDSKGMTAFLQAIELGNLKFVEKLVEKGADINIKNNAGLSALHIAFHTQYKDSSLRESIFLYLFRKGVDVNSQDSKGNSLLLLAVETQSVSIIRLLLQSRVRTNVHVQNAAGENILHISLKQLNVEMMEYLLKLGVNINHKNIKKQTLLHLLIERYPFDESLPSLEFKNNEQESEEKFGIPPSELKTDFEVFEKFFWLFIKNGINLDLKDNNGNTALHAALIQRKYELFKLILQADPELELSNQNGKLAIHTAVLQKSISAVKALIQQGANVDAMMKKSKTVLHLACGIGFDSAVEQLISSGADINFQDLTPKGNTAIHIACKKGSLQAFKLLIASSGRPNVIRRDGKTCLHLVAKNAHFQLLPDLLQSGIDINAQDLDGNTPLHLAIIRNNIHTALLLIKLGADTETPNLRKKTPLSLADPQLRKRMKRVCDRTTSSPQLSVYTEPEILDPNLSFRNHHLRRFLKVSFFDLLASSLQNENSQKVERHVEIVKNFDTRIDLSKIKILSVLDLKSHLLKLFPQAFSDQNLQMGYLDEDQDWNIVEESTKLDEVIRFSEEIQVYSKKAFEIHFGMEIHF
eukprot:Anaeramoba_ignava/a349132_43.p1 GENE.a349132_43~~a349132_43.p1  ORF type:complete len:1353 (-),score=467.92 a349132_43:73-4131(-)